MRFYRIFEKTLQNANLRRVRLKIDPLLANLENYADVSSFEGYILKEDADVVEFMIFGPPNGGQGEVINIPQSSIKSIVDAPIGCLEVDNSTLALNRFKTGVIAFLDANSDIANNPQTEDNIHSGDSFESIESIVQSLTNDPDILVKIYRKALEQK